MRGDGLRDHFCWRPRHTVVTHNVWKGLGERIRGFLDSINLEDLTLEAREKLCSPTPLEEKPALSRS